MATYRYLRKLSSQHYEWAKSNPHSKDAGAPKAACPREGGEECEHSAGAFIAALRMGEE